MAISHNTQKKIARENVLLNTAIYNQCKAGRITLLVIFFS